MATVDIVRLPDGAIQVLVNGELTFEQAAALSDQLVARIGQRVRLVVTQAPEQHRPDVRHVHVVAHGRLG
jgi:hypothetical protein